MGTCVHEAAGGACMCVCRGPAAGAHLSAAGRGGGRCCRVTRCRAAGGARPRARTPAARRLANRERGAHTLHSHGKQKTKLVRRKAPD